MNARDFYFTVIAPEERYASYQKAHGHRVDSHIREHSPRLSNDILLERVLETFATANDLAVAQRIESCFVAKRRQYDANAHAKLSRGQYSGDLIFFYVGLSDLCFQYAIAFSEFLALRLARLDKPDHDPDVQNKVDALAATIKRLGKAQKRWRRAGTIRLKEQDVLSPTEELAPLAAALAWYTDYFVLAHEVAHHLLGHTGQIDDGRVYLEQTLPSLCEAWRSESGKIAKELEADALGLLLVLGLCRRHESQAAGSVEPELPIGTLLTISVLGQCGGDASVDSTSHPAPLRRYQQARAILEKIWQHPHRSFVFRDIERFQVLLSWSQGHGIGQGDKRMAILHRAARSLRRRLGKRKEST